jgi:hypothetical protein
MKNDMAFPVFDSLSHGEGYYCRDCGMTLRDWFAGQALVTGDYPNHNPKMIAAWCYEVADAMLAKREADFNQQQEAEKQFDKEEV